tara:strand:+ start:3539 stop:3949 length:411 start_codon:yes stop_codon:yes gene_type:complete
MNKPPLYFDSFVLPFPPSANTYYRSIRMGNACRVLLSKKGREYKTLVQEVFSNLEEKNRKRFPIQGRISCNIMLHPPTRRKMDIDNRIKPLLDGLQFAGFYEDDSAIDHLTVKRGEIKKGGEVWVQLIELPPKEET